MDNLFTNMHNSMKPLAEKMRPENLDNFVGQQHILGEGKLLRRLIQAQKVPSCIFFGPPGTGKTTLARIIAENAGANFVKMNAISSGVADAKAVIADAKKTFEMYGKKTYLLLDEIHRWSKTQSDALLASLEEGFILLIGSTTENPSFALTHAIVSRVSLFEFKKVEAEDIGKALLRAIESPDGLKAFHIKMEEDALRYFTTACAGDVRSALNGLEIGALTTSPNKDGERVITKEIAAECLQRKALSLNDDVFYHILSAFCKSLRGSDATAALYYANRLIEAGCEPQLLARRTICHASEDCRYDSGALTVACNALYALNNLGMPEGNLALSQAIVFVCEAPKDNSVCVAMGRAIHDAQNNPDDRIPAYLRNHTDASKNYKYPHDYPGGVVEQQYLPDSLKDRNYFQKDHQAES